MKRSLMAKAERSSIQYYILLLVMIWVLLAQYIIPTSSISVEAVGGGRSCIARERDALLTFKGRLHDPNDTLSSWRTGQDCCRWKGVACSNVTGHVVKIDLRPIIYEKEIIGPEVTSIEIVGQLGGEIDPCLLALEHLSYLDLTNNDFGGRPIPRFMGSFKNLKYLKLSQAGFGGAIPPQLGNLSNLLYLDLSFNDFESVDLVAWLPHLSSLKHLDMTLVNLSADVDWVQSVNMLPSLRDLNLTDCNLNPTLPSLPIYFSNLTALVTLDLGYNYFHGPIPLGLLGNMTSLHELWLGNSDSPGMVSGTLKNLHKLKMLGLVENEIGGDITELVERLPPKIQTLWLGSNHFTGNLSWIENMTGLHGLYLWDNNLTGPIPPGIGNLTRLRYLDLTSNQLYGRISEEHFTRMAKLEELYSSDNNNLTMQVDSNWIPPFKLKIAYLNSCLLGPNFPKWIQSQTDITHLEMSNTGIADRLPDLFWYNISHVKFLDLSHNHISGVLPLTLEFMSSADTMILGSNQFQGRVPQFPPSLWLVDLSNNYIFGPLPSNLGAPNLTYLLLSNNAINGTIPLSICDQMQSLELLDLSNNNLAGQLPHCRTNSLSSGADHNNSTSVPLVHISFRKNSFSGEFPLFFRNCLSLNFLDLSHNNFSGSLPLWIGKKLPNLFFLILRSNMFSGHIPLQLQKLDRLLFLDLAHNNFSGTIAPVMNLKAMSLKSPYKRDFFSHSTEQLEFEFEVVSFVPDSPLISLLVATKGQDLEYNTDIILLMVSLDLSSNNLTGEIPTEIGALAGLKSMNLSGNRLTGNIPKTVSSLLSLESLDLSNNELFGQIPSTLSALTSLSHLNLSYNNLSGRIPSGQQLQTLDDPSIYEGNDNLCGFPLPKNCSRNETTLTDSEEYKDEDALSSLYLSMGLGFAVGFWVIFGPLLFNRAWRITYFLFIDIIYDKIYVLVVLNWGRLVATMKKK